MIVGFGRATSVHLAQYSADGFFGFQPRELLATHQIVKNFRKRN